MSSTDDIIAALERSLATSAPLADSVKQVDRRWGLELGADRLPEPEPEPPPQPQPDSQPELRSQLALQPELEPELEPEQAEAELDPAPEESILTVAHSSPELAPAPEIVREVQSTGDVRSRSTSRGRKVAARLHQATASSQQKQRPQHHFHRRRPWWEQDECEARPAAAAIDLSQFVQSSAAEALATLEQFNAEVEDQLVQAGSAAARPETWTSWASTFHPELAEVQRPVSTRGAATTSGCVRLHSHPTSTICLTTALVGTESKALVFTGCRVSCTHTRGTTCAVTLTTTTEPVRHTQHCAVTVAVRH
jgi:hypothetical protein